MRYSYYPGCSLHSTASEYDLSTRAVMEALGVELVELSDWNCCGASSGHASSHFLTYALPLRNLILAEKQAAGDLLVPCAACYNLLKTADYKMASRDGEAESLNSEMQTIMGRRYEGRVQVRHVLEVLALPEIRRKIAAGVTRPLSGLKVAAYYGCLLSRPPQVVAFEDNPEQPTTMDAVLRLAGAEPVPWWGKTDCCGASLAISQPGLVETMVGRIVSAASYAGATALVTACPLCQSNLDTRQAPGQEMMPVFFITELLGLALGLAGSDKWLRRHMCDTQPVLAGVGGSLTAAHGKAGM
ncbi:MAG: disulfide reductase [Clostridia bacterium]|nr:MAG: disulfide reductase [Clostridia bacterium]